MGTELLLLLLAGAGIGGIGGALWARRAQDAFLGRVRTEWVRAGRIIRFGPVGAVSFGTRPRAAYTGGAVVYAMKKVRWTHPLWHLFVLAGTLFHFFSIWNLV